MALADATTGGIPEVCVSNGILVVDVSEDSVVGNLSFDRRAVHIVRAKVAVFLAELEGLCGCTIE